MEIGKIAGARRDKVRAGDVSAALGKAATDKTHLETLAIGASTGTEQAAGIRPSEGGNYRG
jgi:hypothetical protein